MLKRGLILFLFFISTSACFADLTQPSITQPAVPPITQPQNVDFEHCTKMFSVNKEKLFYLTLGAITANRFSVDEIQTNNGYVIFTAANNKFLATIAGIDADNSILKITPCNDIYFFPPGVVLGIFKYVGMNVNTSIK
jgi:hypothetical protein